MIAIEAHSKMQSLNHPRHEHYAQLVAAGQSPAEAYAATGYKGTTAYTCGPRLLKRAEVQTRVTELQQTVAQGAVTRAEICRELVLRELLDNALKAKQAQQWSASNRALELLGEELGMFQERPKHFVDLWDGDLTKLTDQQIERLLKQIEAAAREQGCLLPPVSGGLPLAGAVVVDTKSLAIDSTANGHESNS